MKLPPKGRSREEVLGILREYKREDLDWGSGRAFGYVFDPGKDVVDLGKQVYSMFLSKSGLDFSVYPSLLRLENDLVALLAAHLGGDANVVGNFTSGGTESIMLAVKAARDFARATKPGIERPEMILPETGHAAFHKAAHYLGLKVVPTAVDPRTFQADVTAVRNAITANTILIVGSAPSYAHGVIDPIEDLARVAQEKDILFHCDCCMGGFLLPYFRRLGEPVPPFDFSVPGITSISVDLHKYAYTPKGASLVLYRSRGLRRFQMFTCARWAGYTVINPTVQSTKTGGPLAAAWAVLQHVGDDGYLEIARRKLDATRRITKGIEAIPDLRVLARPQMSLVAFTSETVNVFHIVDEVNSRGWYIQPQLAVGPSPANIHLSINLSNVDRVDEFLRDLRECVDIARTLPSGTLLGQAAALFGPESGPLTPEKMEQFAGLIGFDGQHVPKRLAPVNEVFNILPPEVREAFLLEFANAVFSQTPES